MATKNIKVDEATAKKLYKTASPELKIILEETFGKAFFSQKIKDLVSCFDDILRLAGKRIEDIIPWPSPINKNQKSQNALAKLQLISEIYNEGEVLDWNNRNQSKWYIWFERKVHGGWVVRVFYNFYFFALAPAGCYFKSREDVVDAQSKFMDIWLDYLPE